MLWVNGRYKMFLLFQCEHRRYTSEFDVQKRHILTSKIDQRSVRGLSIK